MSIFVARAGGRDNLSFMSNAIYRNRKPSAKALRIADAKAKADAHNAMVAKAEREGCPCCGAKTRRNPSLTGWVQCGQYGAVGFRADSTKPACSWQEFYR